MSDDPIVQILVEAYQRGKEIALAKKVNAPSHPPQANPVTPTAKPVRARRKVTAAVKPCAVVLAWVCGFFALAQGDHAAAHRDLQQAQALSDEMEARRELGAICWTLAQLESERGNGEAAERLRERARAETAFVADHIGMPKLRTTFLARADVRSIVK